MAKVVITGCYQLLHEGHLNLIRRAAEYGELTVLLNNDAGVMALKGYLAEPYEVREQHLLDTGLVAEVVPFYTDPTYHIWLLKPDYLIAGSDHTKAEMMAKGGTFAGEVIVLPYTEGICSTDLYKAVADQEDEETSK